MRSRIAVILGLVFLTAGVVLADKVTSDYDRSVNFSKFRTFMWIQAPQTPDPFLSDRIMAAVNRQLQARGLKRVNKGADLAVGANMATEEKHEWETYYTGSGWDWGGGWATTTEKTYQVGTLTVDLFDTQTQKLVWQGVGVDKVSHRPQKRTKESNEQIEKMFKDFPMYSFGESSRR